MPDTVSVDLIKGGFSLLQFKHKVSYCFFTRLPLPLRKVIAKKSRLSRLLLIPKRRVSIDYNIWHSEGVQWTRRKHSVQRDFLTALKRVTIRDFLVVGQR